MEKNELQITDVSPKTRAVQPFYKLLVASVALNLCITGASIYAYDHFYAIKIVNFDMRGFIEGLRAEWLQGKIDDKELTAQIEKLAAKLKEFKGQTVVISSEVILNKTAPTIVINDKK